MEDTFFAGGCFWGVQYYFDQVPGVLETTVGYMGGTTKKPTYEQVCSHATGHAEVVHVVFDSNAVTYTTLVQHFFRLHDPTQSNGQGPDVGDEYRSAIFYVGPTQKEIAEHVKCEVQLKFSQQIVTEIRPATVFYRAEAYHQKFAERTGRGVCHIPYRPLGEDVGLGMRSVR